MSRTIIKSLDAGFGMEVGTFFVFAFLSFRRGPVQACTRVQKGDLKAFCERSEACKSLILLKHNSSKDVVHLLAKLPEKWADPEGSA